MDTNTHRVFTATMIYYLMIGVYYLFTIFPQGRVWGVNWWAYWPDPITFSLLLIGLLIPAVAWLTLKPLQRTTISSPTTKYSGITRSVFVVILLLIACFIFYLCRSSTHFLGDGYLLISKLTADNPFIELRNYGAMIAPYMIVQHLTSKTIAGATLAYQLISYVAGICFIAYIMLSGKALFDKSTDRISFILLMLAGGYMLLFFGYVENYAPFILSVAMFTISGIKIAMGRLSRLWIIPLLGLCIFFHIFGIFLSGAALYLLIPASIKSRIRQLPIKIVVPFTLVLLLGGGIIYQLLVGKFILLSLTFLPIIADRFVVEGYTLFSLNHLLDYLNLILILSPPSVLFISIIPWKYDLHIRTDKTIRFLIVMLGCVLLGTFLINPKLGMPRDWDLFAFAGIPLTAFFFFSIRKALSSRNSCLYVMILATTLSILILGPRVASQMIDDNAIKHLSSYMDLDQLKSKPVSKTLHAYFLEHEMYDRVDAFTRSLNRKQPKRATRISIYEKGANLCWEGSYKEAIPYLEESIRLNPMHHPAYKLLGFALARLNLLDSALVVLDIANTMNPNNPTTYFELGMISLHKNEMRLAESYLTKSLEIKPEQPQVSFQLALFYAFERKTEEFDHLLPSLIGNNGVKPFELTHLGNYLLKSNDTTRAIQCYRMAIDQGLDSLTTEKLQASFPKLLP